MDFHVTLPLWAMNALHVLDAGLALTALSHSVKAKTIASNVALGLALLRSHVNSPDVAPNAPVIDRGPMLLEKTPEKPFTPPIDTP